MILEIPQSWLIHKTVSGDTSLRIVFFTAEQGLLNCFYKGGRAPKKHALLQAFTPLWVALDVRHNAYFVRQVEIMTAPCILQGNALFAAIYMNELLQLALRPQESHQPLHEAYTKALSSLQFELTRFKIEMILRRFEWMVLVASGYAFSMRQEAYSAEPIVENHRYHFIPGAGFTAADQGYLGEHILALANDHLADETILTIAKQIMRRAIHHAIDGREIKSRKLYKTLS